MSSVSSLVCHHTAGPKTGDMPSLHTLIHGRPGLNGPLSQLGLARSGLWYVIAAGKCNHAGVVRRLAFSNANSIGIEAEATGVDTWPEAQLKAYYVGAHALSEWYKIPVGNVLGHKEVCFPRGRKSDPNFSMSNFRAHVVATQNSDKFHIKRELSQGNVGNDVKMMQKRLNQYIVNGKVPGWSKRNRISEDGQFGPATAKAVYAFKKSRKFEGMSKSSVCGKGCVKALGGFLVWAG